MTLFHDGLLIKPVLLGLIQSLVELLPSSVVWERDPQPFISDTDRAKLTLNLKSSDGDGVDEIIRRIRPDGQYETRQVGQRFLMLTIKCEAYDFSIEAMNFLERLRMRLRRLSVTTGLNPNYLALIDFKPITDLPTTYDERVVSVATMDVRFASLIVENLTDLGLGDTYISEVIYDGKLDDRVVLGDVIAP